MINFKYNNVVFNSQNKLKQYFYKIIEDHTNTIIDDTFKHYIFLLDLLKRHPDHANIDCKRHISFLFLNDVSKLNTTFKTNRVTSLNKNEIVRCHFKYVDDDIFKSFSLLKCLSGKYYSEKYKKGRAFRSAIFAQIYNYRYGVGINDDDIEILKRCCRCGSNQDVEVDHIYQFKQIIIDFVNEYGEGELYASEDVFKFEDEEYVQRFQEYHLKVATLQFLCNVCHKLKK